MPWTTPDTSQTHTARVWDRVLDNHTLYSYRYTDRRYPRQRNLHGAYITRISWKKTAKTSRWYRIYRYAWFHHRSLTGDRARTPDRRTLTHDHCGAYISPIIEELDGFVGSIYTAVTSVALVILIRSKFRPPTISTIAWIVYAISTRKR